eukprot:4963547-Alexandrium_andersonii.AAC.1
MQNRLRPPKLGTGRSAALATPVADAWICEPRQRVQQHWCNSPGGRRKQGRATGNYGAQASTTDKSKLQSTFLCSFLHLSALTPGGGLPGG